MPNSASSDVSIQPEPTDDSPSASDCLAVRRALRKERDVKKNLRLNYKYFEFFVYSQWIPNWLLLLLRCLIGGTCISVFLYVTIKLNTTSSTSSSSSPSTTTTATTTSSTTMQSHFYLVYLTIWSYLMVTLYFICTLVNTISVCCCSCRKTGDGNEDGNSAGCCSIAAGGSFSLTGSGCGYKTADRLEIVRREAGFKKARDSVIRQLGFRLQWLLHTVASDAALLVTLAYFSLLYNSSQSIEATDLLQHGINSVFMFIEALFGGVPVRLVNMVYAACYAMIYVLFSVFYWVSDNTNVIYPVLDWNNPSLTIGVVCGLVFGCIPLVHTIWWAIHLLRCCIGGALLRREAKCSPTPEKALPTA